MLLYNLAILLYGLGIKIAALKKTKAKQWVNGRKNWQHHLNEKIKRVTLSVVEGEAHKLIWVHCASYGEFEQGRTLIESIKKKHPSYKIILTFFSPSGYEAFKNWPVADIICYLPLDTNSNANQFLQIVKPQLAIFIKYEFWLHFLKTLKQKKIPTYLVSGVFKPHHLFFKWYGGIYKKSLTTFNTLFIQDENSANLLKKINVLNYQICGDTRFDRVIEIKRNFTPLPFFDNFCKEHPVFIAGSTYFADEELIINTYKQLNNTNLKLIIVPHDIDQKNITRLRELLIQNDLNFSVYSQTTNQPTNANILIIDVIGLLNKIYHYAAITYIGGGFNSGLHNTLEPAVYGKPILFYGLDSNKYNEVTDLINLGAAKNINSSIELKTEIETILNNKNNIIQLEEKLNQYFLQKGGSTQKVIAELKLN